MGAPQYEQAGADIAGSGTAGTIPVWSTGTTLGNSPLTVSGSDVTGAGAIAATGSTAPAVAFARAGTPGNGMYFPSASTVAISAGGSVAVTFGATAGLGATLGGTTGLIFNASGTQQGIKLASAPGNADTQTLDAYYENTWTATDGSGAGLTYTVNNTAVYTRIGRLVHVRIDITFPVTANASNALINLPANAITYGGSGSGSISGIGMGLFLANGAGIEVYNTAGSRLTNANLSAARLVFSAVYQAA